MAVKHYIVLGFQSREEGLSNQPYYLGKTSDLVFKPEPDKTIDCDDGSTETGSEKLNLQFSILGKVVNPWNLKMIWLVPLSDTAAYMNNGAEIIKIHLDSEDYRIDAKSGEFEKILFNASFRYPVEKIPYSFDAEYFDSMCIIIGKNSLGSEFMTLKDAEDVTIAVMELGNAIVEGYYAFAFIPSETEMGLFADDESTDIDAAESIGVIRRNWV